MDDHQIRARGVRVRALLENEDVQQAFLDVDDDLKERLFATAPGQAQEREEFYYMHKALALVMGTMHSWISDGELAADTLDQQEQGTQNDV